jgi:hypothetical protein
MEILAKEEIKEENLDIETEFIPAISCIVEDTTVSR